MAAEHWFRWHHGTVNDPKWRVVAARASAKLSRNVTVGHVLSVWASMLECASQANPRGTLVGWMLRTLAPDLALTPMRSLLSAMQCRERLWMATIFPAGIVGSPRLRTFGPLSARGHKESANLRKKTL